MSIKKRLETSIINSKFGNLLLLKLLVMFGSCKLQRKGKRMLMKIIFFMFGQHGKIWGRKKLLKKREEYCQKIFLLIFLWKGGESFGKMHYSIVYLFFLNFSMKDQIRENPFFFKRFLIFFSFHICVVLGTY